MLLLRFLLIAIGMGLFGGASGVVAYDMYLAAQFRRLLGRKSPSGRTEAGEEPYRPLSSVRQKQAQKLAVQLVVPLVDRGVLYDLREHLFRTRARGINEFR